MIGAPAKPATILIVDDEVLIRLYLRDVLEEAGYRVLEAADGAEALSIILADSEIGVLITDVNMPGAFDGFDLAARTRVFRPNMRIVVISGNAIPTDTQMAIDGFLAKPCSPSAIKAVLQTAA